MQFAAPLASSIPRSFEIVFLNCLSYFPESYIKVNGVQRNDFAKALSKLSLTWGQEECDVLDVGCGTADVTRHLLRPSLKCKNPHIVGIDMSQAMVDYSRTSCTDEIKFHVMNIATYEDPRLLFPNRFDKILQVIVYIG
ncbi:hypothetical protein B566_EDAN014447 [Ephemera danica]|nr:hypothetical protein B566_EDAN014447 [Ephemera danica]